MNKVKQRCANQGSAKFLYASKVMFGELKAMKFLLYLLNVIPVVICFLPELGEDIKKICTLISFGLTLIIEFASQLISDYKEKAIYEQQIYESEITGSTFSKTEYDRELTNEMQELAIRKGMPKLLRDKSYPVTDVPEEISDEYSYLYIARTNAAKIKYVLSREFYFYLFLLICMASALVCLTTFSVIFQNFAFYYIICFWPVIIPLIRNAVACRKTMRQCVKICADIDNFFSDGDDSLQRLARFHYYVQNIEFEMLLVKPTIFKIIELFQRKQIRILCAGVAIRFEDAITELKTKKYISQPKGKTLITKVDYDLEALKERERKKKEAEKAAAAAAAAAKPVVVAKPAPVVKSKPAPKPKPKPAAKPKAKPVAKKKK